MSAYPPSHLKRFLLLGAACLQNSLTTGLLFGFSGLQPALQKINGKDAETIDFGQVFTLAAGINMLAPLLLAGPLLDAFGPRMCSSVCTFLIGAGFLIFGLSPALPWNSMSCLLPAMVLIGAGGPGCQCCLFHTANLFKAKGLAMNLITAFIGPSFGIFGLLADLSNSYETPLQHSFLLYSSLPFACTLLSVFIMSDAPFSSVLVSGSSEADFSGSDARLSSSLGAFDAFMARSGFGERALLDAGKGRAISCGPAQPVVYVRRKKTSRKVRMSWLSEGLLSQAGLQDQEVEEEQEAVLDVSLRNQLCSGAFIELNIIFIVCSLFYNLFLGNMQDEARVALFASHVFQDTVDIPREAERCVSIYLRFSPMAGLLNPILGGCIDRLGFLPMLVVVLLSGGLHSLALRCGAFFVSAALFSLFTNSFFSYMFSYLAFEFGFEHYGLLAGVIQCMGSLATLTLQPCLRRAAATYGWPSVQLLEAAAFALLGFWIFISRQLRRMAKKCCKKHLTNGEQSAENGSSMVTNFRRKRAYSEGDLHVAPSDQACRRRSEYFPVVDDILLVDGAYPDVSKNAYQL